MTDRRLSCKKAFLTRLWGKVTERWVLGTLGSMTSVEWTGVIRTLTCLCCSGCFCCGIEGNHTEQQLVKPAVRRRKKRLVWSCSATGPLTECQWTHRRRWRTRRHDGPRHSATVHCHTLSPDTLFFLSFCCRNMGNLLGAQRGSWILIKPVLMSCDS